jgi:hypothetical protein
VQNVTKCYFLCQVSIKIDSFIPVILCQGIVTLTQFNPSNSPRQYRRKFKNSSTCPTLMEVLLNFEKILIRYFSLHYL